MKRYLVTGGAGFIGSYLVKRLLADGNELVVFDNLERGRLNRLSSVLKNVTLINGDIRNYKEVERAVSDIDVVYHLAAVNGTENFYKQPRRVLDVGLRGVLNIMDATLKMQTRHVIVASSAEVYQTANQIPTSEKEMLKIPNPTEVRYSYGGSKIASELVALNWGREMNCVQVFRPHNIYGPDMGWKHVIPNLISKISYLKTNRCSDLKVFGSGEQTRSFCYVDDLIDGLLSMETKGGKHDIFHIGNEQELKISELVNIIAKIMEVDVNIVASIKPEGETERRCPDISKMRSIGFKPQISIEEGVKRTVEWYLKNPAKDSENEML